MELTHEIDALIAGRDEMDVLIRDSRGRLRPVLPEFARHEREWRIFQKIQSAASARYDPMAAAWSMTIGGLK